MKKANLFRGIGLMVVMLGSLLSFSPVATAAGNKGAELYWASVDTGGVGTVSFGRRPDDLVVTVPVNTPVTLNIDARSKNGAPMTILSAQWYYGGGTGISVNSSDPTIATLTSSNPDEAIITYVDCYVQTNSGPAFQRIWMELHTNP